MTCKTQENLSDLNALTHLLASFKTATFEFQKAHWLISGKDFYTLHEEFENYYNWSFKAEDEIAELMLRLRNEKSVPTNLTQLLKHNVVSEINVQNNETIIKDVLRVFHELTSLLLKTIKSFEYNKTIEGKLIDLLEDLETFEWKLNRYNIK